MAGFTLPDGSAFPTNQFEQYRTSVHGVALLERGDIGAPACNDCHGNHAALPPDVASVSQICRTCHARNGILFDGSTHKQAFERNGWPECGTCHGKHAITKANDEMLAPKPSALCYDCHAKHSKNPECTATAQYFYDEITGLTSAEAELGEDIETYARRGLDTQPMHEEFDKLFDSIKQSRSYVHAFERSEFAEAATPGHEAAAKIRELMAAAREELRYRFRGLLVTALFIAATIVLLWIKVRAMERDRG
jgi:predicted CXXCH cytochrome family protein